MNILTYAYDMFCDVVLCTVRVSAVDQSQHGTPEGGVHEEGLVG